MGTRRINTARNAKQPEVARARLQWYRFVRGVEFKAETANEFDVFHRVAMAGLLDTPIPGQLH